MKKTVTKKTAKQKVTTNEVPISNEVKQEKQNMIQNGLADVLGISESLMGWGPGSPGVQLSQVDTLFKNNRWYLISNMRQLLSEIYVEHGLIQTLVDVPVNDAFRGGIEVKSKQLDEEQLQKLMTTIDREQDLSHVAQAMKWNRLFGGAGVLILTDQDQEEPLDLNAIKDGEPLEFRAVDLWELFPDAQSTGGYDPNDGFDPSLQLGKSEFFTYYGRKIHRTRVMPMKGLQAPSFIRPRLRGWGFSIVESVVRSINQYLKANDLSFEVLDEFKVDIYKIKNLTNSLVSANGSEAVRKRIQLANQTKNYQNAIVMDSEDDYASKQISFGGIAETMAGIRMQIASDLRMPLTKVFGISAAGFSSGEDDIENYNSMVESEVRQKSKYDILRIVEIRCQYLFGMIPDDLQIEFKPLRVLSSEQEENVKSQKFSRLLQAKQAGELTTIEFRDACNRHNLLGITLDVSTDELNPDDPQVKPLLEDKQIEASATGGKASQKTSAAAPESTLEAPTSKNSKELK